MKGRMEPEVVVEVVEERPVNPPGGGRLLQRLLTPANRTKTTKNMSRTSKNKRIKRQCVGGEVVNQGGGPQGGLPPLPGARVPLSMMMFVIVS